MIQRILRIIAQFAPVVLFVTIYLADSHRDITVTGPVYFGLLLFTLVFSDAGSATYPEGRERLFSWWIRLAALVSACLLYVLLLEQPYQGMVIYHQITPTMKVAVGIALTLLAILLVRPPRPWLCLLALVAAALCIRVFGMSQWEIHPARRDMIPLIISAIESFLDGQDPYTLHQMQFHSVVPLTYPPLMWLAWLPAYGLGVDVRWTTIVADILVVLPLGLVVAKRVPVAFGPVCVGMAAYLFLPDTHWNGIYAEPHVNWAIVSMLAAAVINGRHLAIALVYGLALAVRPFNVLFAPFLIIWLVRTRGLAVAWRTLMRTGVVVAVLYLPFVLANPDTFFLGAVRWLLEYGEAHRTWFHETLGFSGLFYLRDLHAWLPKIQGAGLLVFIGLALVFLRNRRHLLIFWALANAFFIAFNSLVWMSFWIGATLIAVGVVGAARVDEGDERPVRRVPLVLEVCLSVAVCLAGGLMAWHLYRHFDDSGRVEVESVLEAEAEPGDVILDRSGWRFAFLDMPSVFEEDELPEGTVLQLNPYRTQRPRRRTTWPGQDQHIWVVERFDLFAELRPLYLGVAGDGPYELTSERQLGRYRLLELSRIGAPMDRWLSADLGELAAVYVQTENWREDGWWNGSAWTFAQAQPWEVVESNTCRIRPGQRRMIWAHPWQDAVLSFDVEVPMGASSMLVVGGVQDAAVEWRRAGVEVSIQGSAGLGAELFVPNLPGLFGAAVAVSGEEVVTLGVSAVDVGRRHFCIDARFFR